MLIQVFFGERSECVDSPILGWFRLLFLLLKELWVAGWSSSGNIGVYSIVGFKRFSEDIGVVFWVGIFFFGEILRKGQILDQFLFLFEPHHPLFFKLISHWYFLYMILHLQFSEFSISLSFFSFPAIFLYP